MIRNFTLQEVNTRQVVFTSLLFGVKKEMVDAKKICQSEKKSYLCTTKK